MLSAQKMRLSSSKFKQQILGLNNGARSYMDRMHGGVAVSGELGFHLHRFH
jgi:hypothetical protein